MQSERVTFLTTPDHKASLSARAAAQRVSVGEYIRRKTDDEGLTPEQEAELAALVAQVNEAMPAMLASLDGMSKTMRQTTASMRETIDMLSVRS